MADLKFDWFGIDRFANVMLKITTYLLLSLNPNQPKRRPTNEGTRSLTKCLSKLAF